MTDISYNGFQLASISKGLGDQLNGRHLFGRLGLFEVEHTLGGCLPPSLFCELDDLLSRCEHEEMLGRFQLQRVIGLLTARGDLVSDSCEKVSDKHVVQNMGQASVFLDHLSIGGLRDALLNLE